MTIQIEPRKITWRDAVGEYLDYITRHWTWLIIFGVEIVFIPFVTWDTRGWIIAVLIWQVVASLHEWNTSNWKESSQGWMVIAVRSLDALDALVGSLDPEDEDKPWAKKEGE